MGGFLGHLRYVSAVVDGWTDEVRCLACGEDVTRLWAGNEPCPANPGDPLAVFSHEGAGTETAARLSDRRDKGPDDWRILVLSLAPGESVEVGRRTVSRLAEEDLISRS